MKLQREVEIDRPSDYTFPRTSKIAGWFSSAFIVIVLSIMLFGCTIKVETVDDQIIDDVSEACEMIFEGKFNEFKSWFDNYVQSKVFQAMIELGCVPLSPEGWDCSLVCESAP